jgi:hypothetical protein
VQRAGVAVSGAAMEAVKFIVLTPAVVVLLAIQWQYSSLERKAVIAARHNGLSTMRVAPPCNRWGAVPRCDVWTLCGAYFGGVLGFGMGLIVLDALPADVLLAAAGAVLGGWRCRVLASILATEANGRTRRLSMAPLLGGVLTRVVTGVVCGLFVAVLAATAFGQHGVALVVETVGASAFLIWRLGRPA